GMMLESVGRKQLRTPLDWQAALLDARVGQALELAVLDGGQRRVLRLVPEDIPPLVAERARALDGFELVTLTPQIRSERGLVSERVAVVDSRSASAWGLGLREGGLCLGSNGSNVDNAEEAAALLRRAARRGLVRLVLERQGQRLERRITT